MTTNAKLDCVVTDVVRRLARETTPEEMQARGVRTVRSVSLSRVASLIENAIQTALMQRQLGVVEDHQKAFSEAAREEFVRLIEGGSPQAAPPEAGNALHRLKSQLRTRRENLAEDQKSLLVGAGQPSEADSELEQELRQVFAHWGGDAERLSPLEQEITQVAVLALRQERGRGAKADLERRASEIDLLERRVAKLSGALTSKEEELARVLAAKDIDPGLQSLYSEVQGLSGDDAEFERKSELMTALFAANIELRARIDVEEQDAQSTEGEVPEQDPEPIVTLRPVPRLVKSPDRAIASEVSTPEVPNALPRVSAEAGELPEGRDWSKLWSRGHRGGVDPSLESSTSMATESKTGIAPRALETVPPVSRVAQPETQVVPPVATGLEREEVQEEVATERTYVSAPSWLIISP